VRYSRAARCTRCACLRAATSALLGGGRGKRHLVRSSHFIRTITDRPLQDTIRSAISWAGGSGFAPGSGGVPHRAALSWSRAKVSSARYASCKPRTGVAPYGRPAGTPAATGVERFRLRESVQRLVRSESGRNGLIFPQQSPGSVAYSIKTIRRHGAKNADYRGGVTCLYDTQLLDACLHASECGDCSRPEAVRGMPDVPIAPPATGPPEGWAAVALVSPASFNRGLQARLLRILGQ